MFWHAVRTEERAGSVVEPPGLAVAQVGGLHPGELWRQGQARREAEDNEADRAPAEPTPDRLLEVARGPRAADRPRGGVVAADEHKREAELDEHVCGQRAEVPLGPVLGRPLLLRLPVRMAAGHAVARVRTLGRGNVGDFVDFVCLGVDDEVDRPAPPLRARKALGWPKNAGLPMFSCGDTAIKG
jgi:hypothetical protein